VKYKAEVLKRHPTAQAVVVTRWSDGTPCYVLIQTYAVKDGKVVRQNLDIHNVSGSQGYAAAWRSAWFWMVRHPAEGNLRELGLCC